MEPRLIIGKKGFQLLMGDKQITKHPELNIIHEPTGKKYIELLYENGKERILTIVQQQAPNSSLIIKEYAMKVLFCTIISMLFCAASGNCQLQGRVLVCEFEVPRNINLDNLGEKKKFPIDYCALANFGEDRQLQLDMPISKTNEKMTCIKITDFLNSKKRQSAIARIVAWQAHNKVKYNALNTRLANLQAGALAAFRQKFYGKNNQEPARVSTPPVVQSTFL